MPKQLAAVREMCVVMDASASRQTPRSRTELTGVTLSAPIRSGTVGTWCMRRLDAHHITSVVAVLSCRRLLLIHADMSSIQAETAIWKLAEPSVWQKPYTCVSSAYSTRIVFCLLQVHALHTINHEQFGNYEAPVNYSIYHVTSTGPAYARGLGSAVILTSSAAAETARVTIRPLTTVDRLTRIVTQIWLM